MPSPTTPPPNPSPDWRERLPLVELLVVVAIIALLIAILVPAVQRAKVVANTVAGLSNLRQIGLAVQFYAEDYDQYLPPGGLNNGYASSINAVDGTWHMFLDGHMNNRKTTPASELPDLFRCRNATIDAGNWHYSAPRPIAYQINNSGDKPYRMTQAIRTTEIIYCADGTQNIWNYQPGDSQYARSGERFANDVAPHAPGNPASRYYDPADAEMNQPIAGSEVPNIENESGAMAGYVRWRQGNNTAANAVFLDAHAQTMRIGTILNRNVHPDG